MRAPAPIFDRMEFGSYEYREYPKAVYKGKEYKIVNSEEEEAKVVKDWVNAGVKV